MKTTKLIAVTMAGGILGASLIAAPAFAWHPKGTIKKYVQNQTTATAISDANDAATAVASKPGDILKYVIEVKNVAPAASNRYNDMYFTTLTDTLPAGVELVSDPAKRTITESLGILKPGESTKKEYLVKVTSTKNNDVIQNKACFTGDSEVKDNPQSGCDTATVKVTVPPVPVPPVTPPVTPAPPVPTAPVELPKTGASAVLAPIAALTAGLLGYAASFVVAKRRNA